MKLSEFKFLADENIDSEIVKFLRDLGLDVNHIPELGLSGISDLEIIRRSHRESRAIITHDSDFGTLIFTDQEPFFAIVYIRPGHFDPHYSIETLGYILKRDIELSTPAILVVKRKKEKISIRLREV